MPYTPYSIFGLKMKHILSPGYSSYIAAALLLILLPDLHEHLTSGTSSSFQRILVNANRVIEMSDRILDIYPTDSRSFLIKFYAPWCHHCQELEPVWNQVAQKIANTGLPMIVGRIDCTKYSYVGQHFGIRGFPTIMYVKGEKKVEFKGERSLEDILDFASRVSGPPVHYLDSCEQLEKIIANSGRKVAFVNVGPEANENFTTHAASLQQFDWFYRSMEMCRGTKPGVYAFKARNIVVPYEESKDGTMDSWIRKNRFPQFAKITNGNLHLAVGSQKLLAITLVEEFRSSGRLIDQIHSSFRRVAENIAYSYPNTGDRFLFGWSSSLDTINSIAMQTIKPVPNMIVINTTSIQYYLYDDGSKRIQSQQEIVKWLDAIIDGKIEPSGGDRYHHRIYRWIYEILTTLNSMFQGNPVLTMLLFGVPGAFFSMIIYLTCFSDWSVEDTGEEEDEGLLEGEEDDHPKNE